MLIIITITALHGGLESYQKRNTHSTHSSLTHGKNAF